MLWIAAPASAQDRLSVDLGVADVSAGPDGVGAHVGAGSVDANVTADTSGVGVEAGVGPVEDAVNIPAPSVPTPPATPSIPDPGGTVGDVVGNTPIPGQGNGRTDPAAGSGNGGGGGGGSPGGAAGGGSSDPAGRDGRATDRTRGGGGDDADGRAGTGDEDGGGGGSDAEDAGDAVAGDPVGTGIEVTNAAATSADGDSDSGSGVTRTLERVVEVIPMPMWIALFGLALLALVLFGRGQLASRRAHRLTEQRAQLLRDVGLLQQALLPEIPARLGDLATSVAYRPADGPAAGGDFYDAFLLDGERVAIIVGDVSGHGRAALARTALMRYTLRAYLDAGLEPRRALKVAGRALDDDLGGDFATVVVAVHDPAHATLTYASAGHPPPIVTGSGAFDPVTALSSPPIGAGLPTGQRQTTLHLPGDAVACFFTDGLVEAKYEGGLFGRDRLANLLVDLGPDVTADRLIEAVASDADTSHDDMAACVLRPDASAAADHVPDRLEEVELNALDLAGDRVERYLTACGVPGEDASAAVKSVEASVGEFGGALLRVRVDGTGTRCEVESAAGLHDPLGAPPEIDDAPGVRQPMKTATSDSA
jgi:serine phosphatase RsbU (regulator of sigma subunit)